jgi:hypothetical protein
VVDNYQSLEDLDFWLGLSLVTAGSVGIFLTVWNNYRLNSIVPINTIIIISFYSLLALFVLAGFFWMKFALKRASG